MDMNRMTSEEFAVAVKNGAIVVLPIGGTEAHGSHLPLGTDTFQPEFVAKEVCKRINGILAPVMPYAYHSSMMNVPGTVSLSFDTVRSFVRDFLDSMERHGVSRTLIISGHAGTSHLSAVTEACREFKRNGGKMDVFALCDYYISTEFISIEEDGHAGCLETSRIMAILPDCVKNGTFNGILEGNDSKILDNGSIRFKGLMQGSTANANKDLGNKINDYIIEKIVKMMVNE